MKLMRFNNHYPVRPYFNQVLDNLLTDSFFAESQGTMPSVNITENADAYVVQVAAPGLSKELFNLQVNNRTLTISAKTESHENQETPKYNLKEFSYHSFSRSFRLPESVNTDGIEAKYQDGILWVNLPKKEEAKPKPDRIIAIA
jgi:HSP20 family protein